MHGNESMRDAAQETDGAAIHVLGASSTLANQFQELRDVVETIPGRINEVWRNIRCEARPSRQDAAPGFEACG